VLHKTFALLHRSLRTDVRLLRTHLFRTGLLALVLFWLFEERGSMMTGSPGLQLFSWLLYCNFWFITLSGGLYFSTAITEEKEEQTLGLLRLAGISPPALLLGKWLPRVVGGLLLIAIQVPFTLLSITLGGVLMHQILAAYCTLAAYLVLCGSIGLFSSVICARSGSAVTVAFVLLAGYFLLMPVFDWLVMAAIGAGIVPPGMVSRAAALNDDAWHMSAFQRLEEIMQTGFDESLIGIQVAGNVILALLFGVASWLLFDLMTRNETAAIGVSSRWIARLTRLGRMKSHRVWRTPLVWKDFHQFAGGGWTLLKFVGYPILIAAVIFSMQGATVFSATATQLGLFIIWIMIFAMFLELAVLAARVFRDEIKAQTWPLLALLPRNLADISYAKLAGGLLGLTPAVYYFLIGVWLALSEVVSTMNDLLDSADALLLFSYVLLQFVLFWHLSALLSIVWRWAAWPLALFIAGVFVVVGNGMLVACLEGMPGPGPGSAEALLVFLCFVAAGMVFAVHVWIGMALDRIAGE
jgi:ABC-type transport system involved in multi-copper enzyme maturation permease subunit